MLHDFQIDVQVVIKGINILEESLLKNQHSASDRACGGSRIPLTRSENGSVESIG
jgi:hypothetical protein